MTASVESIIAAALAEHTLDYVLPVNDADSPQWIAECDCDWAQITDDYRTGELAHAAHQAAAVMAALREAGTVEWGIFRKSDAVDAGAFDEATFKTKADAEWRGSWPAEIVSRVTLPWQEVEARAAAVQRPEPLCGILLGLGLTLPRSQNVPGCRSGMSRGCLLSLASRNLASSGRPSLSQPLR